MFGYPYYYHRVVRKYIDMFGGMFNDIQVRKITKLSNNKTKTKMIRVPLGYGPKQKFLAKVRNDHLDSNKPSASITLPRLSFEMTGITYDENRSFSKFIQNSKTSTGSTRKFQRSPVPYNIEMSLVGMFSSNDEALQVLEQINPFFRPDWTYNMKLVPDMDDRFDIATVLNDFSMEETYEDDFETRKEVLYTWTFTIKGYLFGPVENKKVIDTVLIDTVLNEDVDGAGVSSRITTYHANNTAITSNTEYVFDTEG